MTDVADKIGKTIKVVRTRRGLTQAELADEARVSVSYLSLVEQGKRKPGLNVLERIAAGLGIPLNILVFLASDLRELEGIDRESAEKLSLLAWKLIESNSERAVV